MVKKIGNFQLGNTLGSGSFGKVKYAIDTKDPQQTAFAVKMLNRKSISEQGMDDQLKSEIAIMKMLSHNNVVKMFQVIQSASHVYIVLELITGGELFDRIVEKRRFQEPQAKKYFQQLIFGVHYCHQRGIAHRDLKPENLLLDAHDNLKISDFGLSAVLNKGEGNELLKTTCGTPSYVAPEVLKSNTSGDGYDGIPVDNWSSGIILFVMLAGYLPFDDPSTNGLFLKIESGEYRMPRYFGPQVKHVIGNLIVVDPKKRWTTKDVMMDAWFREGVDPKLLQRNMNVKFEANGAAPGDVAISDAEESQINKDQQAANVQVSAFELASNLVMGSLTPLVSSSSNPRSGHSFVMNASLEEGIARLKTELEKLNAKPERGNKNNLKGYTEPNVKGVITFVFQFKSTVCPTLTMCEARRMRGDTLEFHKFYRSLLKSVVDIVPCQPPAEDGEALEVLRDT